MRHSRADQNDGRTVLEIDRALRQITQITRIGPAICPPRIHHDPHRKIARRAMRHEPPRRFRSNRFAHIKRQRQPRARQRRPMGQFAIVRTMVFLGAALYIASNVLIDIAYTWVDPRVRLS